MLKLDKKVLNELLDLNIKTGIEYPRKFHSGESHYKWRGMNIIPPWWAYIPMHMDLRTSLQVQSVTLHHDTETSLFVCIGFLQKYSLIITNGASSFSQWAK